VKTDRLMAFTDGVLAIAITIMVLDLRVPASRDWEAIRPAIPLLAAYALAYVNIGIFWTNHHHMLATASRVNGRALWANLYLLFWLTLMPFVIRWIGLAGITSQPVAAYGVVTVLAASGYICLERELILAEGTESRIRAVVGSRTKEWVSFFLYGLGVPAAFISPWIAIALYIGVSCMWLIPDRRFERWHSLQQSEARSAPL
jgi:TMEM175 potassium channel family protein